MSINAFAFACLGFLIGNLVGLSATSALAVIIPLLFTFGGGSAIAFLPKLDTASRKLAATAVIALSLSCLIGVYFGIFVSEHQFLSASSTSRQIAIAERKYLRSTSLSEVDVIDQKLRTRELTAEEAYRQLYQLVKGATQ
jgi:hypothetical protein